MARKISLLIVIVAIIVPIAINFNWSEAQKTARRPQQQQQQQSSWSSNDGQQQNSVYGGYSSRQQSSSAIATPSRARTPSYSIQKSQQQTYQQAISPPVQSSQSNYQEEASNSEADAEPASYGAVAGKPGVDFPAFTQVPKTSFTCDGVPYEYGMYADEETGCQAYHVCYNGRKDSFLCGVGTVFNQRILHCDYWYSVDCGKSSQYYGSNAYMGSSQPEPGPAQASGSGSNSYQRPQQSEVAAPSGQRPNSAYGGYQPQSSIQSPSRTRQEKTSYRQPQIQQQPQQQQQVDTQEETNY